MVALKNGVSERGGRPVARVVLEVSLIEVSLVGKSTGSALIITAFGLACLIIATSGLTGPDTQMVLFTVGVETAIDAFPTWEMGKKEIVSQPWQGDHLPEVGSQFSSRRRKGQVYCVLRGVFLRGDLG